MRSPCKRAHTHLTPVSRRLILPPMLHLLTYIALIVGINVAFAHTPLIPLPNGDMWPPLSLIVGFTFVVRDYAQKKMGHHILWAMLLGCGISWFLASPELALASAAAFGIGEMADWAIFTFTKRPFSQRIIFSSLIGAPLDSLAFLTFIGLATPVGLITMTASKLVGACIVFILVRRREELMNLKTQE